MIEGSRLPARLETFCAWSPVIYVVLLVTGFWPIMDFFPHMHEPSWGKEQIAKIYAENHVRIRLGAIMMMWAAPFCMCMGSLIALHIARMGGDEFKILSMLALLGAFANAILTFYPGLWWTITAFRADRGADLIYLLNDSAWLQLFGGLSIAMPLFAVVGIASLADKSAHPVFPRPYGYFNLFCFVLFLPDQLLFFFYRGPFAWNGLIAVWIPLSLFLVWFLVTAFVLYRAAQRAGIRR